MAPPHNPNARRQPGVCGRGSANLTSWEQSDSELLPTAQGSLAPAAKRLLADLEIIAQWREDLNQPHGPRAAHPRDERTEPRAA